MQVSEQQYLPPHSHTPQPHHKSAPACIEQSRLPLQPTSKTCDHGPHTSRIGHRKAQPIPTGQSIYSFKTTADTCWQPIETIIQSRIEELASTPIPDAIPVPEANSSNTPAGDPAGDEELESNPDNCFPIDVDAIDSELNTQGFDPGNASSGQLSTAPGEDYFTPGDEAQDSRYVADREQNTPLLLEDFYRQYIPVTGLSPDSLGYSSGIQLDQEDDTPELLISLYPHGILQALLLLHPATAINIIECRLGIFSIDPPGTEVLYDAFQAVKSDWQHGLQNRDHQFALLRALRAYEHDHKLYSLESKLDADFLVRKGRISSKILTTTPGESDNNKLKDPQLKKPWSWLRGLGMRCKEREYILRGAIRHLARIKLEQSRQRLEATLRKRPLVRLPGTPLENNPDKKKNLNRQVLQQYIQEQPDTIQRLLTSLVCFTVKCHRNSKTIQAAKIVLATGQQEKTPQNVQRLIEQLASSNLLPAIQNNLKEELHKLHCTRLEHELESSKCATASLPALLDTRRQLINVAPLNRQITNPLSDGTPGTLEVQGHQVSAQLIHRFLESQLGQRDASRQEMALYPRWFVLKPPSCQQIENVLKQPQDSPEKTFYQAVLSFIDALGDFKSDDHYENVLRWMQCYYDVAYYEQKLFVHLIDSAKPHPLLPFENFEQNIEALWQLARARKEMGHWALNPDSFAYYLSYTDIVWQKEESIEDIIAERYRKEYLRQLEYEPCREFKALFGDVFNRCSSGGRAIYTKAKKLVRRLTDSGLSDILNVLNQEGKSLITSLFSPTNPIHTFITDTLSTMLEVAQQSPKFFRVMWGDFALLMPQLESLLGRQASITGLLQRIAICMHGQDLASLFSGDRPRKLDFNPTENPKFATVIKRFQLFRDIITALHAGLPVMEIFLCRNLRELDTTLRKVAWNSLSTYLARQCVSHIKPPLIRLCNSLNYARDLMPGLTLGLTSGFLASVNAEDSARLAHHIGRQSGMVGGVLSFALDPFITRFDKYREKIEKVKADTLNAEARIELQSERKKVASIFGISSLFSTMAVLFVNAFKLIVIIGSPFITTSIVGLSTFFCSSLFITSRFNKFDEVATTLTEGVKTHLKKIFAKDSPKAIEARKRVHKISASVLEKMSDIRGQELRGWKIWKSNAFRLELTKYWKQLPNTEKVLQHIQTTIREKFHDHLKQDAHHAHNFVSARKLVENAMADPDKISSNPELLAEFNRQLTSLHFSPLDPAVFAYQLINLKQEIDAYLLHCCNNTSPGDDIDTIMNTLEAYNIELYKGDYILNTLHMRSTSLKTNRSTGNHRQNQITHDEPTDGSQPSTGLPNAHEAQAILAEVTRKCYEQQLEKEKQLREERMEMVTGCAIHECLKHQPQASARTFPDISTPLLESHLELQIRSIEKAGLPWFIDEKTRYHQHRGTDKDVSGSTYQVAEACASISGGCRSWR